MLRQRGETPTSDLEAARTQLAARRSGVVEEEAEAAVETVREDPPTYLLGGAGADAVAGVLAGLLPAILSYGIDRVEPRLSLWGGYLAYALLAAIWVAFFTVLRHTRIVRIALVWPLFLYSLLAILFLTILGFELSHPTIHWGWLDYKMSPWLMFGAALGVAAFQGFAFWRAYRKR